MWLAESSCDRCSHCSACSVYADCSYAQFFAKIGFAGWLAYPVTFFEIGAGVLLILGVVPRWIAVIATVQLFVAATVHFGNGWGFSNPNGGWEYPIFLSVAAAVLALLGDGKFALVKSGRG